MAEPRRKPEASEVLAKFQQNPQFKQASMQQANQLAKSGVQSKGEAQLPVKPAATPAAPKPVNQSGNAAPNVSKTPVGGPSTTPPTAAAAKPSTQQVIGKYTQQVSDQRQQAQKQSQSPKR